MNLKLVKLNSDCKDKLYFEKINSDAFPPSESMPLDDMFALSEETDADILGIYDGDMPIGFSFIVKHADCAYLYYFAIDKSCRSKGYGSAALVEILNRYKNLQLTLDFEEIEETADNYEQRKRRKSFYLQNGFYETGRYTLLNGERFEVVCSEKKLNVTGLESLLKILHRHRPEFADILL